MPRVPTDYSKTCIYKLVHKEDFNNENIYIGSTSNFRQRKYEHKSKITNKNNHNFYHFFSKKSVYIRENGGWDMWDMIEIEKYPCNDKREAETRERHWIELYKSKLNSCIPTRTAQEWYLENKETHSTNIKLYYEKNKEKITEYKKEKMTCECGCEIQKLKIKIHKQTPKHIKLMTQKNEKGNLLK